MSVATVKRSGWSKDDVRLVLRFREGSETPWEISVQPRSREHAQSVISATTKKYAGVVEALTAYRKHCADIGVKDGN